jgi:hypothetical protein
MSPSGDFFLQSEQVAHVAEVGGADVGPNPGGFYTGPNINVGQINPPSFYQSQELAERPR